MSAFLQRLKAFSFITLILSGISVVRAEAPAHIHDIRLWRAPDNTRIVFDLDNFVEHKMFTLDNPGRIVIDIPDVVLSANTDKVDLKNTPIKSIRTSPQGNGELRVVFELSAQVKPKSFFLKKTAGGGDRLVLDLADSQNADTKLAEEIPASKSRTAENNPAKETAVAVTAIAQPEPEVKTVKTEPEPVESNNIKSGITADEKNQARRNLIIAIDAGHGGEDPGAIGANNTREKVVVLEIAKRVADKFNREKGYKSILVRSGDYYVGLAQRHQIARKANADMFISIHADAFNNKTANGSSVFALSSRGATSTAAQFLADKENQSDAVGGVSLEDKDPLLTSVLVDLSMNYKMESSLDVGASVLQKLDDIGKLHSNRVEQAAFVVLKTPDIPSILVETGFVSNPEEARRLSSEKYQEKVANAIYLGINDFFMRKPPEGSYIAWKSSREPRDIVHVVSSGETLSKIAEQYAVSTNTLLSFNGLKSGDILIGQRLKIPAKR